MLAKLVYFGIQNYLIISLKELNSFINISAVLKRIIHCNCLIYNCVEIAEIFFVKYVHNSRMIMVPVITSIGIPCLLWFIKLISLFKNSEC